ncbi:hypothetical protein ACJX0J_016925, partial [Zea mays]
MRDKTHYHINFVNLEVTILLNMLRGLQFIRCLTRGVSLPPYIVYMVHIQVEVKYYYKNSLSFSPTRTHHICFRVYIFLTYSEDISMHPL